jgi:hypothetical protein
MARKGGYKDEDWNTKNAAGRYGLVTGAECYRSGAGYLIGLIVKPWKA